MEIHPILTRVAQWRMFFEQGAYPSFEISVDAPHPFEGECTNEIVFNFRWFAGARLLLGAGVLFSSGEKDIPLEDTKQFKLSLQEMCQKVIRANLRHPLSHVVDEVSPGNTPSEASR